MVIYIANRSMTIIDCFTSELRNPIRVISDSDDEKVESGNIIFNFSMSFSEDQKERVRSEIQAGNFVLRKRKHGSLYECFTIVNREYDSEDNTISAYCEDEGMDLLNETLTAVNQDENKKKEYTLEEYMSTAVYDSGFSVDYDGSSNVQEMKAEKKALSFSQETALKRVQNLADAYGFEFYVFYDIFQMKIIKKYIKVIEKRGNDNGIQLRVGKEIKNIRETTSIENVATAIIATGNTPYSYHKYADDVNGANMSDDSTHSVTNPKTGKASNKKRSYYGYTVTSTSPTAPTDPKAYTWITMDEYEKLRDADDSRLKAQTVTLSGYKYDDNDIYVDGTMLKSRSGLAKWSRYLAERENIGGSDVGHIVTIKTYNEARDQATLCSLAVADLQKMIKEQVNYEVELAYPIENLNVGDYAYLIDDHAGLYLKARLLELKISELNGTFDATFGDYTAQSSGINSTIQNLANEFKTLSNSTRTYYTWVVYADDSAGTNITTDSNGKEYIGVATNRINKTPDLSDPLIYKWTKIKGDTGDKGDKGDTGERGPQGAQGLQGPKGDQGIQGQKGADGKSSYTHIAYATSADGKIGFSVSSTANAKYLGVYVDSNSTDSTDPTKYEWTLIKGADGPQGIPGKAGSNGRTPYIHFAYANSADGKTGFNVNYFANALYVGTYTDYTLDDSTNYVSYTWARLKGDTGERGPQGAQGLQGPKGDQGIQGQKGADGKSSYTHIAYASSADGKTGFSVSSTANAKYLGVYVDSNSTDSTDPTKYKWTLIKGADGPQGIPGKAGSDGRTPYIHFAYANSADGKTGFNVNYFANALYVGTYTDYTQADSTSYSAYTWSRLKGETGATGPQGATGPKGADGKGIKSTAITYQASGSQTAPPTGTWNSSVPSLSASSPYLWTRTIITYTDNTTSTSYSVSSAITDPRINSTIIKHEQEYYLSTSDTSLAGGSWSTTFPARKDGTFYWVRYKDTHANGAVTYDPSANGKLLTEVNEVWNSVVSNKTAINSSNAQINMIATSVTSVETDLGKKANSDDVKSSMDGISSTIADINKQVAELKVKANSIEASVTDVNNLAQTTQKATAALTTSGLSVDTNQTTKSVVDGTGLTITSKADNSVVAKFTTGESEIQNLKIDGFMKLGAHVVQKMQDTEWDGTTVNGTGWMWNGG